MKFSDHRPRFGLPLGLALYLGTFVVSFINAAWAEVPRPDTSRILRLMGRFGSAHACPLGSDLVLTNGHVADARPLDRDVPLLPYRFSDGSGNEGILLPVQTERCADLAVMKVRSGTIGQPYQRAMVAPKPGERLWFIGYDFSSKGKAYAEKVFDAKVVRVVAGTVILDESGDFGSSGSCVLNAAGEVVAINAWGHRMGSGDAIGGVIGVWGDWLESCK